MLDVRRFRHDWPLWALGGLVLGSTIGFLLFYYFDRYSHTDLPIMERTSQAVHARVQQEPQNADLRVAAGHLLLDSGQNAAAIEQAQEALVLQPDHQDALILLGIAYQKEGRAADAIAHLERVVTLNRDNPLAKVDQRLERVHYELGMLFGEQGQYPRAVAAFQNALAIDRTDADARLALGRILQKQNQHEAAAAQFEAAVRLVPDFAEAYAGLSASYGALGQVQPAAYARAMVALLDGQTQAAANELERVIQQAPDWMPAYLGLGLAYEKLGNRDGALAALQTFLRTHPNDIAGQQALGRLTRESR